MGFCKASRQGDESVLWETEVYSLDKLPKKYES